MTLFDAMVHEETDKAVDVASVTHRARIVGIYEAAAIVQRAYDTAKDSPDIAAQATAPMLAYLYRSIIDRVGIKDPSCL